MNTTLLFLIAPVCFLQENVDQKQELTPAVLVERLVSPNSPANPTGEPFVLYPEGYDHDAQKIVEDASKKLETIGFAAIPVLIKNLDDRRYCRTWSYSLLVDEPVGYECYRLIDRITTPDVTPDFSALPASQFERVKGHPMRRGVDGEFDHVGLSYFDLVIHRDKKKLDRTGLEKWWQNVSSTSIDHIHLAAVNRLIKHEESLGFPGPSVEQKYMKPYRDLKRSLEDKIKAKK